MAWSVLFSPRAVKELAALARGDQMRVAAAVDSLRQEPRPPGCRKLAGTDDLFRVRVGRLRIVYQVTDRTVTVLVLRVADRSGIYRRL